jgi:hypothetical protein
MPGRAFTALLDHAQRQYGYLTPDDARELDVDPTQLRLMAARHTLERVCHGLDPAEVGWHEGIPIVTPERAILGGIEQALGWQLIDQAIEIARARELITKPAAKRLAALRHLPRTPR